MVQKMLWLLEIYLPNFNIEIYFDHFILIINHFQVIK